jgi:caa(3)-type oxidase subunit IV
MTTQPVEHEPSPHYEIVFAVLLVFTILEAGTAYLAGLPATIRVGLLVFLAVVKAALVLLYFMHLRFDRRVFALPFVLGVVLIIPLLLIVNLSTNIPPAHAEAALPQTGAPEAPGLGATGQVIDVTEVSYGIRMSKTTAQAGPVTFHIVNGADGMLHEFIIIQTDQPASELPTDMSGRVIEDAVTIITAAEDIPPANSRNITVNLGAGHYVMICNLPDHYQQGMRIDFTVTGTNNEPPSTPESTPQPEQPTPGGDQSPTPATTATPGTGS